MNSNPRVVIDASCVLNYLVPDEEDDFIDQIFEDYKNGEISFISTDFLLFEVLNGLKMVVKRGRITENLGKKLVKNFLKFDIEFRHDLALNKIFSLAMKEDLTFYDAAYLYLSVDEDLPLLTLDKKLQKLTK